VKVAAYSDEFDTIVVLGYPTEAVDLIAPGRRRPTIGMRLIVACQYTGRCNCTTADHDARKGVQDDITMGPKTYGEPCVYFVCAKLMGCPLSRQIGGTISIRS
jgi:hypothetical protein